MPDTGARRRGWPWAAAAFALACWAGFALVLSADPALGRDGYKLTAFADWLVIDGKLEKGVSKEVRALLDRQPRIKTVSLHVAGGRVDEGLHLHDLFLERGVDTFVFKACLGACTMAFLGGRRRIAHETAKFVFARYFVKPGAKLDPRFLKLLHRERARRYNERGVGARLTAKALEIPGGAKLWRATVVELVDGGFATERTRHLPLAFERVFFSKMQDLPAKPDRYKVRLLRNALKIEGRFDFGLDKAVLGKLERHRHIRWIWLESLGGKSAIGLRLYDLFKARGVKTYVRGRCGSACTIAFLGGVDRVLHAKGKLFFHATRILGRKPEGEAFKLDVVDSMARRRLDERGIDRAFQRKVFSTPHTKMWAPSHRRLLRSGFVTRVRSKRPF